MTRYMKNNIIISPREGQETRHILISNSCSSDAVKFSHDLKASDKHLAPVQIRVQLIFCTATITELVQSGTEFMIHLLPHKLPLSVVI